MPDSFTIELSPRTALITGGSRGIGRAASDLLARAGARVAINYLRDEAAANTAVKEIRASGGEAMALAGDVSQPDQARQLVRDVVSAWGRLDILVNNAGIWDEDVAGRGDVAVWDRTYAINQRGAFLVTDAAAVS
jgi:NAD(P)-dependent dehydrogenase (short-subunit alcohol dehydrogenase family)